MTEEESVEYLLLAQKKFKKNKFEESIFYFLKVLQYLEKDLFEHLDSNNYIAFVSTYRSLYYLYKKTNDIEHALEYKEKSINIEVNFTDSGSAMNTYEEMSQDFLKIGNLEKALEYKLKYEKVMLDFFGNDLVSDIIITFYNNLGVLYSHIGNFESAIKATDKSIAIMEQKYKNDRFKEDLALAYGNVSVFCVNSGLHDNALDAIRESIFLYKNIYKNNLTNNNLARSYNSLGAIYLYQHNLYESLVYLEKAMNIRERIYNKIPIHRDLAAVYGNLGMAYLQIENLEKSLYYTLKTKNIRESLLCNVEDKLNLATAYSNLGQIYYYQSDYEMALDFFLKEYAILDNIYDKNSHPYLASSLTQISLLHRTIGDDKNAVKYIMKAKKIWDNIQENNSNFIPGLPEFYNNIGLLFADKGKYKEAIQFYKISLSMRKNIIRTNKSTALVYNNLGFSYMNIGDLYNAYVASYNAYKVYLDVRKISFSKIGNKYSYNSHNIGYLLLYFSSSYAYATQLKHNNNLSELSDIIKNTLTHWLQYKGSISDFENIITILYNETEDENIKELIVKREDLRKQLSYLYHSKEEDPKKQEIQRERSTQIGKEITQIENTLSQSSKALSEEAKLEKIDVELLVSNINNTEAYLDYAYVGGIYYLFSVNGENIGFLSLDKELSDEINNTISTYTNEVARCTEDGYITTAEDKVITKELLSDLYDLIIKPYKETIFNDNYHNYIISPDGPLGLIPFDALYDGEKYLVETKNITYAPSGKELVRIRRNQSNMSKKIVAFANPDFNSDIPMPVEDKEENNNEDDLLMGEDINRSFRTLNELCHLGDKPFEPLSGTLSELQSVKDAATEEDFIAFDKSQATKENFLKVANTKILHCATHAFYLNCPDTENPLLKTGIAFAGANIIQEDGSRPHVATGLELASMKLQGTELVVLSTCESAAGDIEYAEGVLGLNKAFIQAGAKTVVASLWKAHDKETAEFFKEMYTGLKTELDKEYKAIQSNEPYTIYYAKLIRNAKLEFIKNDKHPLYWAGFVVSG